MQQPRETEASGAKRVRRNGSVSIILADTDILDCPICYGPFAAPIYQCTNGHIICTTCRSKVKDNKCPFDRTPSAYTRNRVIEKLLESVKSFSCKNAEYGCNEILGYLQKNDHEKTCTHSPCSCPLSGCNFLGSSSQLNQHFRAEHKDSAKQFMYDQNFKISLDADDKFIVLQELEDDNILFILHNSSYQHQKALSLSCIASREARHKYKISLSFGSNNSTLTLESAILSSKKQLDYIPRMGLPMVPWLSNAIDGRFNLEICIYKDRLPHWFI